jgi:hypothetical protein
VALISRSQQLHPTNCTFDVKVGAALRWQRMCSSSSSSSSSSRSPRKMSALCMSHWLLQLRCLVPGRWCSLQEEHALGNSGYLT